MPQKRLCRCQLKKHFIEEKQQANTKGHTKGVCGGKIATA